MSAHLHGWLVRAMDLRHSGDYGAPGAVSEEEAREQVDRAGTFVQEIRQAIEKRRPEDESSA